MDCGGFGGGKQEIKSLEKDRSTNSRVLVRGGDAVERGAGKSRNSV